MLTRLELDDPRWQRFVQERPDATVFHDPAWARLLSVCYGYPAFVLARLEGDRATGGLPMLGVSRPRAGTRWISLPFTDHCRPLGCDDELAGELEEARRTAAVDRVEVRSALPGAGDHPAGVVHTLTLGDDAEAVAQRFRKAEVRRTIHRAERDGVVVTFGRTETDLTDVFYGLHLQTRRRLGVPVQPRRFFRLLWQRLIEPGKGFVLVAQLDARPIAAAVFLATKETLIYKFSASDPAFKKARAPSAILWQAIRWGCEHGYERLDLGRSDLDGAGLRAFKSSWGAVEAPLEYSWLGTQPRARRSNGGAIAAIIRRSPPLVCRAVGETLYRYAA